MASLALRPLRAAVSPRVVAIGLGNMGGPLAGRVAASFPTAVYDRDIAAVASHSQAHGSLVVDGGHEQLRDMASHSEFVLTCLPNTDLTRATVDALRPALRPGLIWIDATSGRAEDAAALADSLWREQRVRYLDCAVSGGPRGAASGKLTALVGGDRDTFQSSRVVLDTFADKINYLGPAGSGHLVKAINNALLAANLLSASEGLAAIARHGVDVPAALEAINGSSGRSWVTMQRFPENILTGDPYGFALDMHCKDMENALRAIREPHADGTHVSAPMLELARCLMNSAREQYGADVDHTETSQLAARSNRIDFEKIVSTFV